jgi:hypothetical protein
LFTTLYPPIHSEIGAGIRVPTIRDQSHTILRTMRKAATLIRINPDFPVPPADLEGQTISIMGNGLQSLQRIDQSFQKLDPRIAPGYKVNCCLWFGSVLDCIES